MKNQGQLQSMRFASNILLVSFLSVYAGGCGSEAIISTTPDAGTTGGNGGAGGTGGMGGAGGMGGTGGSESVYFDSCKSILASSPANQSGSYTIDPDGPAGSGSPFEVFCDMESNGGGWTLLARTNTAQNAPFQTWIDILSQNFFFTTGNFTTSQNIPADYLTSANFFAILHSAADLPFKEIRLDDGKGISLQNMQSPKTLRAIYNATGVEPLYRNGLNTGVLLLLGNANHTGMFPCFYPTIDGVGCSEYYDGDQGSQSTSFHIGDLEMCAGGPAAGSLAGALWGSGDCYATDQAGGFGGFTYHRPFHIANGGSGAYVSSGFALAGWSIEVR